jgi:hypothetical protein
VNVDIFCYTLGQILRNLFLAENYTRDILGGSNFSSSLILENQGETINSNNKKAFLR